MKITGTHNWKVLESTKTMVDIGTTSRHAPKSALKVPLAHATQAFVASKSCDSLNP
jgi:hypothetical protein